MKRLVLVSALLLVPAPARAQAQPQPPPAPAPAPAPEPPTPTPTPTPVPTPVPTPTAAAEGIPAPTAEEGKPEAGRFEFGSYGRVRAASDLRGGTGRQTNIIAHGSRLDEESYAELELRREDTFKDDIKTKIVSTLALFPPFFHFSGNPTQQIALRNL